MRKVKDISWEEVFENWRENEANNPGWVEIATKIKGWPDWESWRSFGANQMNLPNQDWSMYQFDDTM